MRRHAADGRAGRRRHRQHLRRHRRGGAAGDADDPQAAAREPAARIIVTGCAAQIEPERFAAMPEVDHVVGNAEKMRPETFHGFAALADSQRVQVNDIMSVRETAHAMIDGFGTRRARLRAGAERLRSPLHVLHHSLGRGPSRSVPAGEVVAQVRTLVEAGYAEVVLTGVDITSYGADLPGEHDARQARAAHPAPCAGAGAPAPLVHRPGRGRRASAGAPSPTSRA